MTFLKYMVLVYVISTWSIADVDAGWCEANGVDSGNIIHSCTNETKETSSSIFIEPMIEPFTGVLERVACHCVIQRNTTAVYNLKVSVKVSGDNAAFYNEKTPFKTNDSKTVFEWHGDDIMVTTEVLSTRTICVNLTLGYQFSVTCSSNVTRTNVSDTDYGHDNTTAGPSQEQTESSTSTNYRSPDTTQTPDQNQTDHSTSTDNSPGNGFDFFTGDDEDEEDEAKLSSGSVGAIVACSVLVLLAVFGGVVLYRRRNNLDPGGLTTLSRQLLSRLTTFTSDDDKSGGLTILYNKAYDKHNRIVEEEEDDASYMTITDARQHTASCHEQTQADLHGNRNIPTEEDEYDHLNNRPTEHVDETSLNVYGMASGNPSYTGEEDEEYDQLNRVNKGVQYIDNVYGSASGIAYRD